jgi:hypothetical protein
LQQAKDKLQTLKPAMVLEAKQAALGKPKRKKRKLKAVTHDDIDDSDDDFELVSLLLEDLVNYLCHPLCSANMEHRTWV